jgi:hypothetical protein
MRILGRVTEEDVVAAFLRGELESERWREPLLALLHEDGMDVAVVASPDVDDPAESAYRARLLDRHRAWLRREGLFNGFPEHVEWRRAALSPDEVLGILYIDWDWWLRLSGGTRRPLDAAARIRRGAVPGVTAEEHESIASRLRSHDPQAPLIAVTDPDRTRVVCLEGHVRLTAYALYPEYLPDELEIFLGTALDMARWSEF